PGISQERQNDHRNLLQLVGHHRAAPDSAERPAGEHGEGLQHHDSEHAGSLEPENQAAAKERESTFPGAETTMDATNHAKSRGNIIKVPDATPGIVFANGEQKTFRLEGTWKSAVAPAVNMAVDVEYDASGQVSAVSVVDAQQIARERMNQMSGVAQ